jgi:hypothetical protein
MGTFRLLGIAAAMFVAAYLGVQWLFPGRPANPLPTFHQVDPNDPGVKLEATSFASDNNAARDALRHAVLDAAKRFGDDPRNAATKALYVEAATQYAQAWLSIVPCIGTRTCCPADSPKLDRAAKAFGSPLDRRVREAMRKAHQARTLTSADFPKETVGLIAELAADETINPYAYPTTLAMAEKAEKQNLPSGGCTASR